MTVLTTYPDAVLQEIAGNKDAGAITSADAFSELFRRYVGAVRATAYHLLQDEMQTEDLVQDIFFTLWKDREQFPAIEDLAAYLFIATRNRALRVFRRERLHQDYRSYLFGRLTDAEAASEFGPAQLAEYQELRKHIQQAIESLPAQQKTAYRLSREQGLSHAEIAAQMNISPRTASDHILKALQHIRQFLQQRAAFALAVFMGAL